MFADACIGALEKANNEVKDDFAPQQFLRMYRVILNPNTPSGMSSVELVFAI